MSHTLHQRRADTGFSTAQLGLYLFLAADAMFYGALYSSHALLRTASTAWAPTHSLPIALLGGLALTALIAATITPRTGARPYRNTLIALTTASLALAGLIATLHYLGAPPAASTYHALIHLYTATTLLHTLGATIATLLLARRATQTPTDPDHLPRRALLSTFNAATAALWATALALSLLL